MNKKIMLLAAMSICCSLTSCGFLNNNDGENNNNPSGPDINNPDVDKPNTPDEVNYKINNVSYDGEVFKWEKPSDKITGYELLINKQKFVIDKNEYKFEGKDNVDFKISCINNDNTYEQSSFTFYYGGSYEMPTYENGVISWKGIENALNYKLNINDEIKTLTTNTYNVIKTGKNIAKVKPTIENKSKATFYEYSDELNLNLLTPPTVQFDKATKTISWNSVTEAKGYSIYITKDGDKVIDVPQLGADANKYNKYDFQEAGEYVISVCARGDAEKGFYDSIFTNKTVSKLEMPTNVRTKEKAGNVMLSWDPVEGADKYVVKLPNGEEGETSTTSYSYPISDSVVQEKFHFNVYSRANDDYVLDSNPTANINLTRLEEVRNIKMQDGYAVWDEVPMAQSYVFNIDGREYKATTNKYQVIVAEGSHIIKVKAVGDGVNVISSSYSNEVEINKLSSPTNVRFENNVLTWDAVAGASNYNVVSENGNVNKNTTSTNLLINPSEITESTTFYVIARGNGNLILDSDPSLTKPAYKLDAPIIKLNKNGLEWTAITGASEYELRIGDYVRNVKGTSYNLNEFNGGSYVCSVKAVGDGNTYFDSRDSQPITANVLDAPKVTIKDNVLTWTHVSLSNGYEVFVDGKEIISLPFNKREFKANFKTAGTHTISVRAVGDGIQSCTSKWVETSIDSELLIAPLKVLVTKADEKHFNISWDTVPNSKGYILVVNGVETYCETNSYNYEVTTDGNYTLSVKAVGDGYKYITSNASKEITFTLLSPVTNAKLQLQDVDFYTLTWNPSSRATSYSIKITKTMKSGGEPVIVTRHISGTSLDIDTNGVASIKIEIIALGDNLTIYDSLPTELTKSFN